MALRPPAPPQLKARDCPCADCGRLMAHVERLSRFFVRPLCTVCKRLETLRSPKDAEIFVLERMYQQVAA